MKILSILICSLFLIVNTYAQNFNEDTLFCDSIIVWSKNLKLTWKDFNASPDSLLTIYNTQADAVTAAAIDYEFIFEDSILISYNVYCYFLKNRSWTKDTLSLDLLMHEQLHFDIAELFTRKMRKKFKFLEENGVFNLQDYKNIAKKIFIDKYKLEQQYDFETLTGSSQREQKKWNEKINRELEIFEEYSSDKEKYECPPCL